MELINDFNKIFVPELIIVFFIIINIIFSFFIKKQEYKIAKITTVTALIAALLSYYTMPVSNIFPVTSKIIILLSALLLLFASHNLLTEKRDKSFLIFSVFLCAIICALGLVTFNNLLYSFLAFLFFGIFSYLLISYRNNDKSKQAANLYRYCLMIASLLFLCGIVIFYLYIGNTDIMYINSISTAYTDSFYYLISSVFIVLAFIIMLGIMPFLNIFENICSLSSSGISTYLTIIPVIAYISFLSKFFVFVCSDNLLCRITIVLIMTFVVICSTFRLIKEENIKKIYAISSVINSALLMIIITGCSVYSISAVIIGLLTYIITMSGLWIVYIMLKTRCQSEEIKDYKGLFYTRPYFTSAYILCIISAIGLPPAAGFIARIYELSALFKTDMNLLYFIVLLICLLSLIAFCYVYLRLIKIMFEKNNNMVSVNKMFLIPKITLYLCTLVILLLFVYPDKLIKISQFIAYYI